MKKFIYSLSLLLSLMSFTSCSDFFDPDTDDELNGEDYIGSDTEMNTGFIGIMTKLQAIGDKEILLTETRGTLVEVSDQSTPDLIDVYNYNPDLDGNPYANPAGYYEVIIACNDYLSKMKEYRQMPGVDEETWRNLVSSAVRIKAWTYKTLAEIYGKAVWFDDPVTKISDLTPDNGFTLMSLSEVIDKCLNLMDVGYDGVPANLVIDWIAWLDPDRVNDIENSQYRKWNYMVPPYDGLYAELCLWKGATLDAMSANSPSLNPAAQPYYEKAADVLLNGTMSYYINCDHRNRTDPGSTVYWLPSAATPGQYSNFWNYAQPFPREVAAAIIYDYANNQTNTLLKHFSSEYPNEYLLRPNEKAMENFLAQSSTSDQRYKTTFGKTGGKNYIAKFRAVGSRVRPNAYQDDVHIYIYRATQYHMMLAEALNHLCRFQAMNGVLNNGVSAENFSEDSPEWKGFTRNWTADAEWGTRRYPSMGIRCCQGVSARETKLTTVGSTEHEVVKFNDLAILDETMLEFSVEGKVYPMMNRMAVRWGDLDIVADRVAPKYEAAGMDGIVRSRILDGGNWVPYDLRVME